ncbi:MAG: AAA family ATPase, partial [Holosporales bacterium]|nr:AAA family ATPase [Holosporales bacterium]
MLLSLSIRNFVLIEHADLSFFPGFTVIIGETGAGKSLLLAAIAFALGARKEENIVGPFAEETSVTLEFSTPASDSLRLLLEEADITTSELVLRRTYAKKGKSRTFLNDCIISQGFLRQLAPLLLEFHGQFSQLWETSAYAPLLDRFGGITVQDVAQRFSRWTSAQRLLAESEQQEAQQKEEASFLTQALEDFDKIHPEEGEESCLVQ